jgi:hypothetical protein
MWSTLANHAAGSGMGSHPSEPRCGLGDGVAPSRTTLRFLLAFSFARAQSERSSGPRCPLRCARLASVPSRAVRSSGPHPSQQPFAVALYPTRRRTVVVIARSPALAYRRASARRREPKVSERAIALFGARSSTHRRRTSTSRRRAENVVQARAPGRERCSKRLAGNGSKPVRQRQRCWRRRTDSRSQARLS